MAKKERFRFSISTILWLTLMVAAFFGGRVSLVPEIQKAKAQGDRERAVAEMQAMRAAQQAELARKLAQQQLAASTRTEPEKNAKSSGSSDDESIENSTIVTFVADGDTVKVLLNREEIWIRLPGIDCPESDQSFGQSAKEFTHRFCFGRKVKLKRQGKDRYDRVLADVIIDGQSLTQALLQAGLAWHLPRYSNDLFLAKLAADAKRQNIGLWKEPHPIPPSEWKKKKRQQ